MKLDRVPRVTALAVLATIATVAGAAGPAAASGGAKTSAGHPAAATVTVTRVSPVSATAAARAVSRAATGTPARVPAALAGPIAQTGCTLDTGADTAACDLYAKPGTVQLPGQANPTPIWGFAASSAGAATLPGPVLVVDQGMAVTVTIHNDLGLAAGAARNLSLAVPAMTGLAPDTTGVGDGASKSYTFTASRPGTYLYEAGHTEAGARQAAMGLVGALVVRAPAVAETLPDGSTAQVPSAYGTAGTEYDDEAVMVLTEVDPALNTSADPTVFDLRKYAPKYRLINGKAYPETDPVASDVGRRVLLRYVDAGLEAHAMTLLGAGQKVLGTDARPASLPQTMATLPLPAGRAADTLVALPNVADGARYALMESSNQLNNNSQVDGSSTGAGPVMAFGGMLTFLDTNPAPPSTDLVGPVATNVAVNPASASVLAPVSITANFADVNPAGAPGNVMRAEAVIDNLSVGEGTSPYTFSGGTGMGTPTWTGAVASIPALDLQSLSQGRHTVYVRAQDEAGNWGAVNSATFTLAVTGATTSAVTLTPARTRGTGGTTVALTATGDDSALGGTVTAAEYYLDSVPPNPATAFPMTVVSPGSAVSDLTATIGSTTLSGLAEGSHTVYVRTQDSFGLWGPFASATLVIDRTAPTLNSGQASPAVTDGTTGSPSDPTDLRIDTSFTDPVASGVSSPIAAAEGFLDTTGADGTGFTMQALDGSFNSATESAYGLIPLSELTALASGTHTVWVHAEDAAGNWGALAAVTFTLDKDAPTVSGLAANPNPTNTATTTTLTGTATDPTSAITAAEWFEGTDPGTGAGHPMTVTATGATSATISAQITVSGLSRGYHTFVVRARDSANHWSANVSIVVTVGPQNAIFSDGFETGLVPPWSSASNPAPVRSTRSALVGTYGLEISGTSPQYLQDTTPTAETSMHVQFQFQPNGYNNNANVATLLRGLTGGNATAFEVQYRWRNGQVANPEMQLVVSRSGGTYQTGFVTVSSTGVHTIRVDWVSATSTTAGSVRLLIDGNQAGNALPAGSNTSAYTVETMQFGLVASGTRAVTASLYAKVDAYVSNRYSIP
jgi:hypothetical protein